MDNQTDLNFENGFILNIFKIINKEAWFMRKSIKLVDETRSKGLSKWIHLLFFYEKFSNKNQRIYMLMKLVIGFNFKISFY